ncbi:MAG: L-threonylcarbamoyladenylate synthase [Blastocatellia bacterium]
MKTKITQSPSIAARYILHGETVAFPTETVYGLGAHAFDEEAIRGIFQAKGRPADNPLIAHIADLSQIELLASEITPAAARIIESFFPGPITVILPRNAKVPLLATAGLNTVGIRMPRHQIARQFLRACGIPVFAPSANLSGRPSPTTWQAVRADLDGRIGCILTGDPAQVGLESTVVDCTDRVPVILRAGAISLERLREVLPEIEVNTPGQDAPPKSPGLKYRHYSPSARVVLCNYPQYTMAVGDAAYIGLEAPPHVESFKRHMICKDVEEYAHALFRFFRECDEERIETIFCQSVSEEGLGRALMDRLHRAAL